MRESSTRRRKKGRLTNPSGEMDSALSLNGYAGEGKHNQSAHRLAKEASRFKDAEEELVFNLRTGADIARARDDCIVVNAPVAIDVSLYHHGVVAIANGGRSSCRVRVEQMRTGGIPQRLIACGSRFRRGDRADQQPYGTDQQNGAGQACRRLQQERGDRVLPAHLPPRQILFRRVCLFLRNGYAQPQRHVGGSLRGTKIGKHPLCAAPALELHRALPARLQMCSHALHGNSGQRSVKVFRKLSANAAAFAHWASFTMQATADTGCRVAPAGRFAAASAKGARRALIWARPRIRRDFTVPNCTFRISAISSYASPSISRRIRTDRNGSEISRSSASTRARISACAARSNGDSFASTSVSLIQIAWPSAEWLVSVSMVTS